MLEYHHPDGIVEWYANQPEGMEHGFVIKGRPESASGGILQLDVVLDGLAVESDGPGLRFVTRSGEPVLSYARLKAWDATGKMLAASMSPTLRGFRIEVADAGAAYPVTIDPTIASLEQKLGPRVMGDANGGDSFCASVALSGDTAFLSAHLDDNPAGIDAGSVYVFVRSGGNWSLQGKLYADGAAAGDQFGSSMCLLTNVAVIGASRADTALGNDAGSVYVFSRSGSNWIQQAKLTASDGAASDHFGCAVSLSGDTVLIGADGVATAGGDNAGAAYAFVRLGSNWSQQARLIADDSYFWEFFGRSVSVSGDNAFIGVPEADPVGYNSGKAYIFRRSGGAWAQQAMLISSNGGMFGHCVSVSGDTALVAAPSANAVHVFVDSGSNWSQEAVLHTDDAVGGDFFGGSVLLSGDRALIGSTWDTTPDGCQAGSAYVFVRSGSNWIQQAHLTAPAGAPYDYFGNSVCLDGDMALVAASGDDNPGIGGPGSAYVFTCSGTNWSEQAMLCNGESAAWNRFGFSVSLFGDTALIGAPYDDTPGGGSAGSAYVFTRSGGVWSQEALLLAADGSPDDRFGYSVSISGDSALIGSDGDDTPAGDYFGSAYVFRRTGTNWSQEAKLASDDAAAGDVFGVSVSLDGDTGLVGAYGDPIGGSAYVFTRSGSNWLQQAKLTADDTAEGDEFGICVALSGETALIGADGVDIGESGFDAGAAYVFVRSGTNWSQQAKLVADDAVGWERFGSSLSLSGDTGLIGPYVFARSGTNWVQQAKLQLQNGATVGLGGCVAGDIALVSGYGDDTLEWFTGSVHVFARSGTNWSFLTRIISPGTEDNAFGCSVSLSGDTVLVGACDANGLDSTGGIADYQGVAYVYRLRIDTDGDGASDIWETAHDFDPGNPADLGTLDTDADGDLDFLEIFQGTDRYIGGSRFGLLLPAPVVPGQFNTCYRRRIPDPGVDRRMKWSTDLIHWLASGKSYSGVTVTLNESVVSSGTDYEIIGVVPAITGNKPRALFLRLELSPSQ